MTSPKPTFADLCAADPALRNRIVRVPPDPRIAIRAQMALTAYRLPRRTYRLEADDGNCRRS